MLKLDDISNLGAYKEYLLPAMYRAHGALPRTQTASSGSASNLMSFRTSCDKVKAMANIPAQSSLSLEARWGHSNG
jgi:hypothetical protein